MKDALRFFSHLNPLQIGLLVWMLVVANCAFAIAAHGESAFIVRLMFLAVIGYEAFLGFVLVKIKDQ